MKSQRPKRPPRFVGRNCFPSLRGRKTAAGESIATTRPPLGERVFHSKKTDNTTASITHKRLQ